MTPGKGNQALWVTLAQSTVYNIITVNREIMVEQNIQLRLENCTQRLYFYALGTSFKPRPTNKA
jgi:hypothetical protein